MRKDFDFDLDQFVMNRGIRGVRGKQNSASALRTLLFSAMVNTTSVPTSAPTFPSSTFSFDFRPPSLHVVGGGITDAEADADTDAEKAAAGASGGKSSTAQKAARKAGQGESVSTC